MPYDRDRPVNVQLNDQPVSSRQVAKHGKVEKITAGSYAHDPQNIGFACVHTAPYEVGTIRNGRGRLRKWSSLTDLRRGHEQGSLPLALMNTNVCGRTSIGAIPGYQGHIQGYTAENVFGSTQMRANELSAMAVDNREPPEACEWRQTTAEPKHDSRAWEDRAQIAFLKATSGMAYHDPHNRRHKTAENLKRWHDQKLEDMYKKTVRTWAGVDARQQRPHANWKHYGIVGYSGHYPEWKKDEDFYAKPELGKVFPPYQPTVRYTSSVEPPFPAGPSALPKDPYPWGPQDPSTLVHSARSGRRSVRSDSSLHDRRFHDTRARGDKRSLSARHRHPHGSMHNFA